MSVGLPEIVGRVVELERQFNEETLNFFIQVEEEQGEFLVAGIIRDAKGATLDDFDYVKVESRESAQNHIDIMVNAVRRYTEKVAFKPVQWT